MHCHICKAENMMACSCHLPEYYMTSNGDRVRLSNAPKASTPERINAALARWLGWTIRKHGSTERWMNNGKWYGYTNKVLHVNYFDPYHRIDHAWVLVEHVKTPQHIDAFGQWCDKYASGLFFEPAQEAARAICKAIIELCEVEV